MHRILTCEVPKAYEWNSFVGVFLPCVYLLDLRNSFVQRSDVSYMGTNCIHGIGVCILCICGYNIDDLIEVIQFVSPSMYVLCIFLGPQVFDSQFQWWDYSLRAKARVIIKGYWQQNHSRIGNFKVGPSVHFCSLLSNAKLIRKQNCSKLQ